jgi:hypothetical protein
VSDDKERQALAAARQDDMGMVVTFYPLADPGAATPPPAREPTVEELIGLLDDDMINGGYDRVGMETLLLMARDKLEQLMGELANLRAQFEDSKSDDIRRLLARVPDIREATLELLGEALGPGPALEGDGWQILPGQGAPGLTCEQYAAEYLRGRYDG